MFTLLKVSQTNLALDLFKDQCTNTKSGDQGKVVRLALLHGQSVGQSKTVKVSHRKQRDVAHPAAEDDKEIYFSCC